MTTHLDSLLARNQRFAAAQSSAGTLVPELGDAIPTVRALIIGCADMRVEPADLFALAPGEALVLRNIGGRVTPALVQQIGLLGRIGEVMRNAPGGAGEFHLIVLQHTDCGITRLTGDRARLAGFFQVPEDALDGKAVEDPRAAVTMDVAALRAVPALPAKWLLSGLVYDVATGLVEVVVPAAPIRG